jgi:hypothetical protein
MNGAMETAVHPSRNGLHKPLNPATQPRLSLVPSREQEGSDASTMELLERLAANDAAHRAVFGFRAFCWMHELATALVLNTTLTRPVVVGAARRRRRHEEQDAQEARLEQQHHWARRRLLPGCRPGVEHDARGTLAGLEQHRARRRSLPRCSLGAEQDTRRP